jgi:NAD(P)-dependent dehydrogenase (short-subunit alcohol dehydrogenase family)
VENMTRAWSLETSKPFGVRMTTVRPGWVRTDGIGPKIVAAMAGYDRAATAIGFDSLGKTMTPEADRLSLKDKEKARVAGHGDVGPYEPMMNAWRAMVASETDLGTPPENVAMTVRDAFSDKWLQPVYTVAYDALLFQAVRDFVPEPVYEWFVGKMLT